MNEEEDELKNEMELYEEHKLTKKDIATLKDKVFQHISNFLSKFRRLSWF
jgi:hypothetical protein